MYAGVASIETADYHVVALKAVCREAFYTEHFRIMSAQLRSMYTYVAVIPSLILFFFLVSRFSVTYLK